MITAGLLLSLLGSACQDDSLLSDDTRVEEGLPATVTLKIKVNDMGSYSRSIIDTDRANYCNNLWVGFYSKEGDRLDYFYISDLSSTDEAVGEYYYVNHKLKSANDVYIFGVANCDINAGVDDVDNFTGKETTTLRDILDDADTLEKFKKVCVLRPDANDVNVYANSLTMSGWYAADGQTHSDPDNIPTVNIPEGNSELPGAIYLRRVIAYNKFIIVPGQYVNLTLNTWQVHNVPAGSSILEGHGNVADNYSGSVPFYNTALRSHQFTATTNTAGTAGHSFEFYQMENKHTALGYQPVGDDHVGINPDATDMYTEREREFKTANADNTDTNTGIYRSLVESPDGDLSNNNASYVVINADIDYYVAATNTDDGKKYDPDLAVPIDPNSSVDKIHRTANINYTIHLGYCQDKNDDDTPSLATAKDFNCKRNSRYTYNVTINGVKNVVVEATSEDGLENQPGAEGWVSDETGAYERLDAHYCEFNISMNEDERALLSYRITAPYGDNFYYYTRDKNGSVTKTDGMNSELYSWVKFYPTSEKTVLAEYNGGKGKNTLGEGTGLWTLDDMCNPTKVSDYDTDSEGNRWYTVFVDEYVYHFDDQGTKETSWPNYVNKDDRVCEFVINTDVSKDTESEYSYNKYTFSQRSIQSYYTNSGTAIGIEHVEETYCLNMGWYSFSQINGGNSNDSYRKNAHADDAKVLDYSNGRYNQWYYLNNRPDLTLQWSSVIQPTVPAHVQAGGSAYTDSHPEADYPIYMPKAGASKQSYHANPSDNDSNSYYANSICMNRNRNNNKDGSDDIKCEDVKWYLPTSSQYIQIAIAENELPSPFIRFTDYDPDYFHWSTVTDYYYGTANFHYITSDYQYYWAEQAVNTGGQPLGGFWTPATMANTARCIRNLGTDPSVEPVWEEREVGYAYTYDADARTFTMNHYSDETLRGYNMGGLAPHDTSSPSARPYKKFEYAKNLCTNLKDAYVSFNGSGLRSWVGSYSNDSEKIALWTASLDDNSICGKYTQTTDKSDLGTWRVPSAYEMALMWIENLLQDTPSTNNSFYLSATYDYFSSYNLRAYTTNNHLYLGYNDTGDRKVPALDCLNYNNYLRCVRDVKM